MGGSPIWCVRCRSRPRPWPPRRFSLRGWTGPGGSVGSTWSTGGVVPSSSRRRARRRFCLRWRRRRRLRREFLASAWPKRPANPSPPRIRNAARREGAGARAARKAAMRSASMAQAPFQEGEKGADTARHSTPRRGQWEPFPEKRDERKVGVARQARRTPPRLNAPRVLKRPPPHAPLSHRNGRGAGGEGIMRGRG